MTLVSYAQNNAEILLQRVFKGKKTGFYIDIGAHLPEDGSITKTFYDLGWNGINVEPSLKTFPILEKARPRDLNLNIAIGTSKDILTLDEKASAISCGEKNFSSFSIPSMSLRNLCDKYVFQEIDFLKVDMEGYEYKVLINGDWDKYRPKVIVCEVTDPWQKKKSPQAKKIDHFLSNHKYQYIYFDGLNNYYVSQEYIELASLFLWQPTCLDQYITSFESVMFNKFEQAELEKEQAECEKEQAECEKKQAKIEKQQVEIEKQQVEIEKQQLEIEKQEIKRQIELVNHKFSNSKKIELKFGAVKTFFSYSISKVYLLISRSLLKNSLFLSFFNFIKSRFSKNQIDKVKKTLQVSQNYTSLKSALKYHSLITEKKEESILKPDEKVSSYSKPQNFVDEKVLSYTKPQKFVDEKIKNWPNRIRVYE